MLVAPCEERNQDGPKVAGARGRYVFVPGGPFAVAPAFEQTRRDQRIEPAREHIRRNPETLLKLIEPGEPMQGIAQNKNAPPLAHVLEAAGDRTWHPAEALSLH